MIALKGYDYVLNSVKSCSIAAVMLIDRWRSF